MSDSGPPQPIKVSHLAGGIGGGGGRAASRIIAAITVADSCQEFSTELLTSSDLPRVSTLSFRIATAAWRGLYRLPGSLQHGIFQSAAQVATGAPMAIVRSGAKICHLHWIGDTTISVNEIGSLSMPLVWTLHDLWPISGSHHLPVEEATSDWHFRLTKAIDWWVGRNKSSAWKRPFHVVCPSRELAEIAKDSPIGSRSDIRIIPNPIDTSFWNQIRRVDARKSLEIDESEFVLVYGADQIWKNENKGWAFLQAQLQYLAWAHPEQSLRMRLIVFGGKKRLRKIPGLTTMFLGALDDGELRNLYSAGDLLLMPSRFEAFGQVGAEAAACGLPAIGLDTSGLRDVIAHEHTGLLVPKRSGYLFAEEIRRLFENRKLLTIFGRNAVNRAQRLWNFSTIGHQYLELYRYLKPLAIAAPH